SRRSWRSRWGTSRCSSSRRSRCGTGSSGASSRWSTAEARWAPWRRCGRRSRTTPPEPTLIPILAFAGKRLAAALPLLAAVVSVNFVLVHLAPGDPVSYLVGDPSLISAEQLQAMRANLGLDRPLPLQYVAYLGSLARG